MCFTVFVVPLNHNMAILVGKSMEFVIKEVFAFNFTNQIAHISINLYINGYIPQDSSTSATFKYAHLLYL